MNTQDSLQPLVTGRVELLDVHGRVIGATDNLVVTAAYTTILPRIVGRDPNKALSIISIGTGGDYDQNGVFQGQRIAPAASDVNMRVELFRAGIVQITFPAPGQVRFAGLIREGEAVSTAIDEFGLLSVDGTMFSHAVNPSIAAPPLADKYSKPAGAIYQVVWLLTFSQCP